MNRRRFLKSRLGDVLDTVVFLVWLPLAALLAVAVIEVLILGIIQKWW